MDIENFNQCIQYLQLSGNTRSTIEKYLPVFAALSGGVVGFLLNYLSTGRKEARSIKNKIMCCNEDVQKAQEILKKTIIELMRMMNLLAQKKRITSNTLPNRINTLCLSKYFTDIAHKYTKNRRINIQLLMENADALNDLIAKIRQSDKASISYENSANLLNASGIAMTAWFYCQNIVNDEDVSPLDMDADAESIEIGATPEQLDARKNLIKNIETNNASLKLPA